MQTHQHSLFGEQQWFDVTVPQKLSPKLANQLLAISQQTSQTLLLHGAGFDKLLATTAYQKSLTHSNITHIICANDATWFTNWLDWQQIQLQLTIETEVKQFLQQEAHQNAQSVKQWLHNIALLEHTNQTQKPILVSHSHLSQLHLYYQQEEAKQVLLCALTGNTTGCINRLDALSASNKDQAGLLLWMAAQLVYRCIGLQSVQTDTNNTKNYGQLYLPPQHNKTIMGLARQLSPQAYNQQLQQLLAIDASCKAASGAADKWLLIKNFYLDLCYRVTAETKP